MMMTCFFLSSPLSRFGVLHQNIRSALTKQYLVYSAIQELLENGSSIGAICLTETFITQGNDKNLIIKGYTVATSFCRKKVKKDAGGSLILVKNGIDYKVFNDIPKIFV